MDMRFAKARSVVWVSDCSLRGNAGYPCVTPLPASTQSQMTPAERDELASTARTLLVQIQTNNTQVLRGDVIPSLAANFDGIVKFGEPSAAPCAGLRDYGG